MPTVVLEAFAAGVPVLGARLGGIAELVRDEVDGLLVAPDSFPAWRQVLARIAAEPGLPARLRAQVRAPRQSDTVAEEMLALYRRCLLQAAARRAAGPGPIR